VLRLRPAGKPRAAFAGGAGEDDLLTVVGNLPEVNPGESLRLEGVWTSHAQYGKQFKAEKCEQVLPASVEGIKRYLGSGLIKGVGPKTAAKIVKKFGADTLRVVDEEPRKLREVLGIGAKKAAIIELAWQQQKAIKNVMIFLQGHGVSTGLAVKIYKQYGDMAQEIVKNDPYRLARDIYGIGFKTADKIARQLGLPPDAPSRVEAGVAYALGELSEEGHVYSPVDQLTTTAAELLEVPPDLVSAAIERLLAEDRIKRETLKIPEIKAGGESKVREEQAVYLAPFYYGEIGVTNRLVKMMQSPVSHLADLRDRDLNELIARTGQIGLSDEQRLAIRRALENKVSVITGGPGTGKCIRSDSLVLSDQGIQPLQMFWNGDAKQADTFRELRIGVVSKDHPSTTSHIYYGGTKKTIVIHTDLGLELEGTLNHRIWAMTKHGPDWMPLGKIQPDTYVAVRRRDNLWGDRKLPPQIAYVLGVISGDGSQSSDKLIQIANSNLSLLQKCQTVLEQHLDCRGFISRSRSTYNLRIHGKEVRNQLVQMGLHTCRAEGKEVPHAVMESARVSVLQYLAGLFDTDGHIQRRRKTGQVSFELTLKSERLVTQVQLLLLNLGIVSRRTLKKVKYRYGGKIEERLYWRLSAYGRDVDVLMSVIPTIKAVPPQHRGWNTNRDVVPLPGSLIRSVFLINGPRSRREWWAWKREIKGNRRPTRQRLLSLLDTVGPESATPETKALKDACQDCYYWDKVLSVEQSCAEVIDLTVPDEESFIANGFVNHNTTALKTLINTLDASKHSYALASPTGRAAKRLSEATGRPAKTIHRLLGFQPGIGFNYNEEKPLPVHMLIVDEASMIDLLLMNSLLKALDPATHLLLVGDVDQLPSVGAGDVLRDVIDSNTAAVTRLSVIFRQAQDSLIITNAHRINRGEMPITPNDAKDYFLFVIEDPEEAANWVVDVVQNRIPAKFGLNPVDEVQVLSPMYRGVVGVANLNTRLQEALNPASAKKGERKLSGRIFRVGDKLMATRNNYDKDTFNGDIGRLRAIDLEEQTLTINFEGREVNYDWLEADELAHAFAISVHKSQGSEYPAVVLPMLTQHYMMLQRNLLYTAITRAKKLCVLVGTRKAIAMAVKNATVAQRYSGLEARLREK
ncbi:MAG TPA: helix-hairpin-helix domain-containing protein, partial [Anaerolineales bacterium]|nr:helix-hairpin-helix domain-containing protein [Anaerolineales bacterium]